MDYRRTIDHDLSVTKLREFIDSLPCSSGYKYALRHMILDSQYGVLSQPTIKPVSMDLIKELMHHNYNNAMVTDSSLDKIETAQLTLMDFDRMNRNRRLIEYGRIVGFTTYENSDSEVFCSMSKNLRSMIDTTVSFDNVIHWNCIIVYKNAIRPLEAVELLWFDSLGGQFSCKPPISVRTFPKNEDYLKDIKVSHGSSAYRLMYGWSSREFQSVPEDYSLADKRNKKDLERIVKRRNK